MATFINAADAVAAAIEIEHRGFAFYESVAEKATATADKEFFTFMAAEEKRHEGIFKAMLDRIGGLELPAGIFDEEYLAYVRGLLDAHTLFMPGQEARILESPLGEAMRFEKDTLIFFMELEGMVPESEKHLVCECADEERKHLRMLVKRLG